MSEITDKILHLLSDREHIDSLELAKILNEDHQKIVGSVKSLECLATVIRAEQRTKNLVELTDEGLSIVKNGSHEAIVFAAVPSGDGVLQNELMNSVGAAVGKVGLSKAIKSGWIKTVKKEDGKVGIIRVVDSIEDKTQEYLKLISEEKTDSVESAVVADLKKRKLAKQINITYYHLTRGPEFNTNIDRNLETDLTPEMLLTGSWNSKKFKSYNFDAKGVPPVCGHLHPLMKVRAEFRSIFLEMGFSEMPSNRFVESSFWNFDALFVPQKHPARDAQDTFFMKNPEKCVEIPEDYMNRVKDAHTGGSGSGAYGYGTLGYGPDWSKSESNKNCLRTHTTAVTARMLHEIGSKVKSKTDKFSPVKLFSIDRVYRNETLDATHLAEFHQVEGVIADYGINLGNLIGVMKEFFGRLGISSDKLRFKPAYNPYTEPSMEVFCYHDGLKKWVELGNSGMFRPEVLLPMGIPKDVRVIAWGLSLERPTMIRYGINNIRDLVGQKVDLRMVYENPICRL